MHFFHFFVAFMYATVIYWHRSQHQMLPANSKNAQEYNRFMTTPRFLNPRSALRKVSAIIASATLLAGASNSWAATSVGANFIGRDSAAPTGVLAPAESAGVVPQTQWNNVDSGGTFQGTTAPLVDSAGNFTAVTIIYDASDSWNSDGGVATP